MSLTGRQVQSLHLLTQYGHWIPLSMRCKYHGFGSSQVGVGNTVILMPDDQVIHQLGKPTTWSSGAEPSENLTASRIGLTAFFPPSCYSVPSVCDGLSLAPEEGKRKWNTLILKLKTIFKRSNSRVNLVRTSLGRFAWCVCQIDEKDQSDCPHILQKIVLTVHFPGFERT